LHCTVFSLRLRKDTFLSLTVPSRRDRRIAAIVRCPRILYTIRKWLINVAILVNPVRLRRTKAKFLYGATLDISSYDISSDPSTLKGLPAKLNELPTIVAPQGLDNDGPYTEVIVPETFPPGSIMLFETQMVDIDPELETFCASGAQEAFDGLNLVELNIVLHRAEGEERDATGGEFGVYDVPDLGKLTYCGLEGWMHPLRHIMQHNDLGHPLSGHLRNGTWSFDYIVNRLEK
jgi:glycogen debranching enzyme